MRDWVALWLERISIWALATLLVTLPFWRHRVLVHRPSDPVFFEFHDLTLYTNDFLWWGAVGAWLLSRLMDRAHARLHLGPWFLFGPLAGFLLLGAIGAPFAVDPLYAGYQTARLLLLLALYLLLVNAPLTQGNISWSLAAGMVLQALVAVPQYFLGRSLGLKRLGEVIVQAAWPGASVVMVGPARYLRAYGLTQHPNLLGGCLMAMLLMVAGHYLMPREGRRLPAPVWARLAALGLGYVTLLITFSRGAWLGTLVGGAATLALLLWARRQGTWSAERLRVALLIAVVVVVSVAFVATNWALLQPRLGLASQGTEIRSVEARQLEVPAALALIRTHPILGVGLGNYPTALYRLAREMVAAYPVYQPVYNVALLVTAELGILGGILWLCLILSPWLALGLARRQLQITPWWAGLSGALVALITASTLDFYVWTSHQGRLALWLVLGLWAREWLKGTGKNPRAAGYTQQVSIGERVSV